MEQVIAPKKGDVMKRSLISILAVAGLSAAALAGCSSGGGGGTATPTDGGAVAASTTACVILPDAASSPRWETLDRPALEKGLKDAGFTADIQNAQGDTAKYATIADQQLSSGCGVIAPRRLQRRRRRSRAEGEGPGHPGHRLRPADRRCRLLRVVRQRPGRRARGPVDRRRSQDRRQGPEDGHRRLHGGDPADGNAKMFTTVQSASLEAAGIKPAAEPPGAWDGRSPRPTSSRR